MGLNDEERKTMVFLEMEKADRFLKQASMIFEKKLENDLEVLILCVTFAFRNFNVSYKVKLVMMPAT